MEALVYTPTYELFLILEPLRRSFRSLCESVEALTTTEGPRLLGVDIYYRATTDVALLALRFDERSLSYKELTWVLDYAAGSGIPVLDPSKLSEADRRQFYRNYLSSYQTRIDDLPGATDALYELGRRLRLVASKRGRTHGEGPKKIASARQRRMGTTDMFDATSSPITPTPALLAAAGDSPVPADVPGNASPRGKLSHEPHKSKRRASSKRGALANKAARAKHALHGHAIVHQAVDEDALTTKNARPLPSDDTGRVARGKRKHHRREETIPETPAARRPTDDPSPESAVPAHKPPASGSGPVNEPDIEVRYRRGGQWTMARLRSLSSKGAYLVTGALPRLGDTVSLAFAYKNAGVTVQATVYHITTVHNAMETGSAGFAVRFPQKGSAERDKLVEILKGALAAGVRIKPPPSRETVRFPVFWPVCIGTAQDGLKVDALDVSFGGMFFTTKRKLEPDNLMFSFPLDNGDSPIQGCARIVRRIDSDTATRRAMLPGYGVSIIDLEGSSRRRYANFVSRVQRRSQARIFVGSDSTRVRELMHSLASVGYEVTGASDPELLEKSTDLGGATVDLAVIDASLKATRADRFRQIFSQRDVRCVSVQGDPAKQARPAVDRVLEIA